MRVVEAEMDREVISRASEVERQKRKEIQEVENLK